MKVRFGFVSNSSSSSFLAIMEKEKFEGLKKSFSPTQLALLNELRPQEQKMFGKDCVVYENMYGNYGFEENIDRDTLVKEARDIAKQRGENPDEINDLDDLGDDLRELEWEMARDMEKIAEFTHWQEF